MMSTLRRQQKMMKTFKRSGQKLNKWGLDKEVQSMLIQEKFERMDWLTYRNESERRGEIKGAIKLYHDEMNLKPEDIITRIVVRFGLKNDEAKKYVREVLGLQPA